MINPIGMTRFSYSKDQVERLYSLMDANNWDLLKSVEALCYAGIFTISDESLTIITYLMRKMNAWREIEGRDLERIWKAMSDYSTHTFDRIHTDEPTEQYPSAKED